MVQSELTFYYFVLFPSDLGELVYLVQHLFFKPLKVFFHCYKKMWHTGAKNADRKQACVHAPIDGNRRHRYTTLCSVRASTRA